MAWDGVFGALIVMGSLLGAVAFFRVRQLQRHVAELSQRLQALSEVATRVPSNVDTSSTISSPIASPSNHAVSPLSQSPPPSSRPDSSTVLAAQSLPNPAPETSHYWTQHPWWAWIQQHWMTLLGGVCMALAGIFLARHAMQQGYIGPVARFSMGLLAGALMHGVAEWLRRRQRAPHAALAALAAGGSITLFAMLLVGLHVFAWLHPMVAFAALALVALMTLWLARLHGPMLALIGMLGAYLVPLFVSTGSGHIVTVLIYSGFISAAVLALLRHVQRSWLWWGWLGGALGWWLLSLLTDSADGFRMLYLAALGYAMMAIYGSDYRLTKQTDNACVSPYRLWQPLADRDVSWLRWSWLLLVAASAASLLSTGLMTMSAWLVLPLWILVLRAAWQHTHLRTLPWWLLVSHTMALLMAHSPAYEWFPYAQVLAETQWRGGLWWVLLMSLVVMPVAWSQRQVLRGGVSWMALALTWPLWMLLLIHHLQVGHDADGLWAMLIGLFGLFYSVCSSRKARDSSAMTFVVLTSLLANVAYAVALVLVLSGASLTLALVLQCGSIAWFMRRYQLPSLGWLLKGVAAWVLLRLTLWPWWIEMTSLWWTLLTYLIATLVFAGSTRLLRDFSGLHRWAEAATWHVAVLTIWILLRTWVYDGQPFAMALSLIEAAVNSVLFAALAGVYYQKQKVSTHLRFWYRRYSQGLLILASLFFTLIIGATLISDYWLVSAISTTPLWNTLWLVYAAPAFVAWVSYGYSWPQYRRLAASVAGGSAFLFVSLQIRHLWQGHVRLSGAYAEGELYTYSVVWLLLALLTMLVGGRFSPRFYQVGLGLLLLVVAKVFLIDLEHLQGMYRILALMGLGVGLLLVALLHQRWRPNHISETTPPSS